MIRVVSVVLAAAFLSVSLTAGRGSRLPGTRPLRLDGDLSLQLVEAMDRFLLRQIAESPKSRERFWSWDYSSLRAYLESIGPNRDRFRRRIGAVDDRLPVRDLELVATLTSPSLVAENGRLRVYAVRWPVLEGVDAEGLLVEPAGKARAQVVVIPDADWTPEMLAGLNPQTPPRLQAARILGEAGCRVLVPALIDRKDTWSGNPRVRMSNQTHREFIYRQAYFMGRHLLGYEVQKVLAALDYFSRHRSGPAGQDTPLGIAGQGEGGLVAFYSAALDSRVRATLVSGYFQRAGASLAGARLPQRLGPSPGIRGRGDREPDRAPGVGGGGQPGSGGPGPSAASKRPHGRRLGQAGDPAPGQCPGRVPEGSSTL